MLPTPTLYPRLPGLCVVLAAGLTLFSVHAQADNGVSANAPILDFYVGLAEVCCGEDPHPVHGIQTPDGGFAIVGKASETGESVEGFIVKIMPPGQSGTSFLSAQELAQSGWSHTVGTKGKNDALNSVAATKTAVFAGGYMYASDGTIDRYLVKYDLTSGAKVWDATLSDPQAGRDGAIESLIITADGGLVVTGLINAPAGGLEGFKSYGNAWGGEAYIAYYSAQQLGSSSAPAGPVWLTVLPECVSGKGVREVGGDGVGGFVVAAGSVEEGPARVVRVGPSGEVIWSKAYPSHGEVTDVAVLGESNKVDGFALVGHREGDQGGIDGSVTMLNVDGSIKWSRSVGDPAGGVGKFSGLGPGNPHLIFDECWGIRATADGGAVIGCGTGIEGCDPWEPGSAIRAECEADPRTIWRGLVIKLDRDGNPLWHRVDSFIVPGEDHVSDSASEYVSLTKEGAVISIVDQGFGIGLLVMKVENGSPASTVPDPEETDPEPEDPGAEEDDTVEGLEDHTSPVSPVNEPPDTAVEDSPNRAPNATVSAEITGCAGASARGGQSALSLWILLLILLGLQHRRFSKVRRSRN